jgi:hypothetical protein
MRWTRVGAWILGLCVGAAIVAQAQEDRDAGERVLDGVISGLLGGSRPSPDAAYVAREQERLAQLLSRGEYATSRQGEPVDLVILGIPLTRTDHVYTARPIPPSPPATLE